MKKLMEMYKDGRKVAEQDITHMPADKAAHLADLQQEMFGREIRIKRVS